jgi:hypothetical protein
VVSQGDINKLTVVRQFRDKVLMDTPKGREYVLLFYKHTFEVTSILIMHPEIAVQSKAALDSIMPQIKAALESNHIEISDAQTEQISNVLDAIGRHAGSELHKAIQAFQNALKQSEIFNEVGITVASAGN